MSASLPTPKHLGFAVADHVGTITLNRPERKNPLTFESYAELRDLFRALVHAEEVRAVVITGAAGNFCSGGDVHDIIGPLTKMDMGGLLRFTHMTGDVVKAMRPSTVRRKCSVIGPTPRGRGGCGRPGAARSGGRPRRR